MDSKKALGIVIGLIISIALFFLGALDRKMSRMEERLDELSERSARSEQSEFYIKHSLERIEKKLEE